MSKLSGYIIALGITAVVLFLVWYFSNILAYILAAAVLAIIGKPLVEILSGLKFGGVTVPRWLSAMTTLITIWAVVVLVFVIFVPLIFAKANELSTINVSDVIDSFRAPLSEIDRMICSIFSITEGEFSLASAIGTQISSIFDFGIINKMVSSVASTVTDTIIAAFSISFITFFFLKEENLFHDMVVAIFPSRYEENIDRALDSVTGLLVRYFRGIVTESSIMTIIVTTGLTLCGVALKDALLVGLITGLVNVIPYVGPMIAICMGLFLGAITPPEGMTIAYMSICTAGTILFAQVVDNFVLQPILYSKSAKAHPLEIFIVILVAGSVAGVVGMLLAIPAYNVIRVFAKEFFNNFYVVQKLTSKM